MVRFDIQTDIVSFGEIVENFNGSLIVSITNERYIPETRRFYGIKLSEVRNNDKAKSSDFIIRVRGKYYKLECKNIVSLNLKEIRQIIGGLTPGGTAALKSVLADFMCIKIPVSVELGACEVLRRLEIPFDIFEVAEVHNTKKLDEVDKPADITITKPEDEVAEEANYTDFEDNFDSEEREPTLKELQKIESACNGTKIKSKGGQTTSKGNSSPNSKVPKKADFKGNLTYVENRVQFKGHINYNTIPVQELKNALIEYKQLKNKSQWGRRYGVAACNVTMRIDSIIKHLNKIGEDIREIV